MERRLAFIWVFFESGLERAFIRINKSILPTYPLTVFYAFKQAETENKGKADEVIASTGWENMLEGLIRSEFTIDGTWPMRTERPTGVKVAVNALASSIVLVCRPRPADAPKASRSQFLKELKQELPQALKLLQQGSIAPVDLAQASIGPGMAVYSRYAAVLENDGSPLTVRTALQLINQYLDEYLTEQEGEFDSITRWALTWFEQYQFEAGLYGDAETLSKAKNVSVQSMVEAGILEAKAGKVRLLRREEIEERKDKSSLLAPPDWLITQTLIHALDQKGEVGAAELLANLNDRGAIARDLAYRLYSLCDKKGWTQEAIGYNSLVISWSEISRLALEMNQRNVQTALF
jgi:putative DNA methylase